MTTTTFNEIIKSADALTLDEQLRLAAYLVEKVYQNSSWQVISSQLREKKAQTKQEIVPTTSRWQAFFESAERPTEDFMLERVDLPPQTREIF
ncbi:hypothetical protein [Candidatus Parabeggiatoa sp. HSG14]|uniref:antitoxin n=1 Tax=Candidatus Parabeggiatoa sp. HSG14 TaxID=3055593 RepID=UPI0025A8E34D|nr:hypothetical protein [Thiotrichales bacterium HSG14]